jgi:hypothetical protein
MFGRRAIRINRRPVCEASPRPNGVEFDLTSSLGTHARLKDAGHGALCRSRCDASGADYWTSMDLYYRYYRQFPLTQYLK